MGEAAVVVGEERGEEGVGGLQGGDAAQAEFDDEAILQGAPEALDAALGLRRAGGDEADAEVPQDPAEVRGVLGALELFLERPVGVVADEDAEAIAVEGQRAGRRWCASVLEHGDVAVQVLGGTEVQGEDGAGGVVDGAEEGHGGPAVFEPGEGTAVELDEGAHAGCGACAGRGAAGAGAGAWPAGRGPGGSAGRRRG